MKKRNNAFAHLVGLLLVSATVLTLTVAATGGAGTSSDPLVTLSYLNEKFLPQILSEVDKKTASREQTLSSKLTEQVKSETQAFEQKYGASSGNASGGTAASFTVVTLNQGQILYMGVGCEAMLRTGSGVCVAASTPGLIDETSGTALAGALAHVGSCGSGMAAMVPQPRGPHEIPASPSPPSRRLRAGLPARSGSIPLRD